LGTATVARPGGPQQDEQGTPLALKIVEAAVDSVRVETVEHYDGIRDGVRAETNAWATAEMQGA
jgi:hypothetical protein